MHKHLDTWLDQMALLFEQQRPPTLLELSALFTRTGASLLGGCLQALAEALYGQLREQRQMDYPECAKRLSRKRTDTQQINGLHGPFALELTGVAVSNHQGHATLSRVADSADLPTVFPDDSQIRRRIEQAKASAQKNPCRWPPSTGRTPRPAPGHGATKSGVPASGAKSKAFACISLRQTVASSRYP